MDQLMITRRLAACAGVGVVPPPPPLCISLEMLSGTWCACFATEQFMENYIHFLVLKNVLLLDLPSQ
jgi:hypothetical protein